MVAPANSVVLTEGSPVVTGNLTAFVAAEFDLFILDGLVVPIASCESPTKLILKQPWPGETRSDVLGWVIANTGPYWQSTVAANRQLAALLNRFEAGPVKWDASGTLAGRSAYDSQPVDFVYLSVDPKPFTLFVKLANNNSPADWSPGQPLQMPAENTQAAEAAKAQAEVAAATATQKASTATTAAGTATDQAGIATGAASSAGSQASIAAQQATAAATARQQAESARDLALPAASQAQAAATATAGDRAQTGNDRTAAGAAVSASQQARDAAVAAAADARTAAAQLGAAAFDWSTDSNPDASNDWSNG